MIKFLSKLWKNSGWVAQSKFWSNCERNLGVFSKNTPQSAPWAFLNLFSIYPLGFFWIHSQFAHWAFFDHFLIFTPQVFFEKTHTLPLGFLSEILKNPQKTQQVFFYFTLRVFFKKTHTLPLGFLRAKCLKTLKKLSINPPGK